MQAVIQTGGKQVAVAKGERILVELVDAEAGSEVRFEDVRLVIQEGQTKIGRPQVPGVVVVAKVLEEIKGPKTRSFKFRRRKDSQCTKGHRQRYHKVLITAIEGV